MNHIDCNTLYNTRQLLGLKQSEMAERAGMLQTFYSMMERGKKTITERTIERFREAFGERFDECLKEAKTMAKPTNMGKVNIIDQACGELQHPSFNYYAMNPRGETFEFSFMPGCDLAIKVADNSMWDKSRGCGIRAGEIAFISILKETSIIEYGLPYAILINSKVYIRIIEMPLDENEMILRPLNNSISVMRVKVDMVKSIGKCVGVLSYKSDML